MLDAFLFWGWLAGAILAIWPLYNAINRAMGMGDPDDLAFVALSGGSAIGLAAFWPAILVAYLAFRLSRATWGWMSLKMDTNEKERVK